MSENVFDNQGYTDNLEDNNNNAIRKKRRRRPNLNDNEDVKPNVDVNDTEIPKKEPRRRRRKEPSNVEENNQNRALGVAAYLEDLQDDIEIKMTSDNLPAIEKATLSKGKPAVLQATGDKVYIEGVRNFRVENHERYRENQLKISQKNAEKLNLDYNQSDNYLLLSAIGITDRFRIFATFVHGLFAGMTLMHLVFSLVMGGSTTSTQQSFLMLYLSIQQPYTIFNYVAFVIVLISLWDRMDVGQRSRTFGQWQAGILVSLILTLIAFLINNVLFMYTQDFTNYKNNSTSSYLNILVTSYGTWRILDAVKSVLICIAWFVIALIPTYDRFIEHLNESFDQDLTENY